MYGTKKKQTKTEKFSTTKKIQKITLNGLE